MEKPSDMRHVAFRLRTNAFELAIGRSLIFGAIAAAILWNGTLGINHASGLVSTLYIAHDSSKGSFSRLLHLLLRSDQSFRMEDRARTSPMNQKTNGKRRKRWEIRVGEGRLTAQFVTPSPPFTA